MDCTSESDHLKSVSGRLTISVIKTNRSPRHCLKVGNFEAETCPIWIWRMLGNDKLTTTTTYHGTQHLSQLQTTNQRTNRRVLKRSRSIQISLLLPFPKSVQLLNLQSDLMDDFLKVKCPNFSLQKLFKGS